MYIIAEMHAHNIILNLGINARDNIGRENISCD